MTSRKSSILKPGRVREPLQDLSQLLPSNDDEETTTTDNHKRRVSFARINKIKEFEAGAECTTLLHTPAYDERFSISSDSYQSSLCEQSHNKSAFELSCADKGRFANHLNYSKINCENVDTVEAEFVDVSRGAPSPGKASVGDSSMDITNMVAANDFVLDQTATEACYPLNLTKNCSTLLSLVQSQDEDKDILESSSMETTEALPCAVTETIVTNFTEPYSADIETSVDEERIFQFSENLFFSDRRLSRKSEIFPREKPMSKRLSDEMIDSEEVNAVASKRRSLTNDSCSDDSSAIIEIVPEEIRNNLIPEPILENQNIVSFVPREERSTFIVTDQDNHMTEIKEIKNIDVDVTCAKSALDKNKPLNSSVEEHRNTLQEEKLPSETCNLAITEVIEGLNENEEIFLSVDDIPNHFEKTTLLTKSEKLVENITIPTESPVKLSSRSIETMSAVSIVFKTEIESINSDLVIEQGSSQPIRQQTKTSENESNYITKDMEITETVRNSIQSTREKTKTSKNESNYIAKDMEITRVVREELDEIITLVCSQNDSKSTNRSASTSLNDEAKCLEAGESSCEDYSMVVECDLEDVLGNLKAVNITENEQDSFIQQENDISMKVEETASVEIVKNSPEMIIVSESNSGNESTLPNESKSEIHQSNDIPITEIDEEPLCKNVNDAKKQCASRPVDDAIKSQLQQKKLVVFDKIKSLIPYQKSDWSIKSVSYDEWIFSAIWDRLLLVITFNGSELDCEAKLTFSPKEGQEYVLGNEISKIVIGPIIRKYKPKLDELCRNVGDVSHLLVLMLPSIAFAKNFAEDFARTQSSELINLSHRIATFEVASYRKHLLFEIQLSLKSIENLNLSDLKITPIIGNVDKDLIYNTFTKAGRNFDFTSKFVKTLWSKMEE